MCQYPQWDNEDESSPLSLSADEYSYAGGVGERKNNDPHGNRLLRSVSLSIPSLSSFALL